MKARRNRPTIAQRAVVGYVRVSTEEQAAEGVSLAAQEARVRAYALAMGFEVSEIVCDPGASAKSLQRPGLQRVLAGVRTGSIGTVIVVKLDRLTRSTRDLAELLDLFAKADAALVSVAETLDTASAAGRMVVSMLGVVAQWEREAIGERTAVALEHKRKAGDVYGSTPFGFRREGDRLVPEPAEQSALAEARRMDLAGASFREIGRMLDARGAQPHRGRAWHASTVRAMLRSRIATETVAA